MKRGKALSSWRRANKKASIFSASEHLHEPLLRRMHICFPIGALSYLLCHQLPTYGATPSYLLLPILSILCQSGLRVPIIDRYLNPAPASQPCSMLQNSSSSSSSSHCLARKSNQISMSTPHISNNYGQYGEGIQRDRRHKLLKPTHEATSALLPLLSMSEDKY